MPDFTGGGGVPGSIGSMLMYTKLFIHQVLVYYSALERTRGLHHCAVAASEVFYPDIRLDINGSYRL